MRFIQLFMHPKLNDPEHEDYRKAAIFVYACLITLVFLISYDIYFFITQPNNVIKKATNIIGTLLFVVGFVNFRLSDNLKKSLGVFMLLCSPASLVSIYNTGGIYSADIIWIVLIVCSAYLFIGIRIGNILSVTYLTYLITLYSFDLTGDLSFKNYIIANNATHHIFTYVFVIALLSMLLISFNRVLQRTNDKLQNLKQEQITELENRIKEKTEELSVLRQELAKDFHDEMGNKLASITILSQSVTLKIEEEENKEEVKSLLGTIEERSLELYYGTKDFIWSIDFKSDYADEWFIYVREFGEDFFGKLGISFLASSTISESEKLRFDTGVSRQLIYILKEMMTNAAKHAKPNQVVFELKSFKGKINVFFSDDGVGFDTGQKNRRGLKNIKGRVDKIKGEIFIKSSAEKGTKITLHTPLNTML